MASDKTSNDFSDNETHAAIWTPGWYELDQTLVLGQRQKLRFFETLPESFNLTINDSDWVFFNQLDATDNCVARFAFIDEMHHPVLGSLLRIDTDGLDYIFFPVEGEEIVVNAEEEPGAVYDGDAEISDWSVHVKLSHVSAPIENVV